ncbi:MAG: calcium-binding protein, partial [Gemmataceae bacterium]
GNDVVTVWGLTVPVFVHGGDGKDVLTSVHSSAILLGGDGDDRLTGGRGHEVLIGGAGRDRINGGHGNNVVIGGDLSNSYLLADLLAASRRWALDRVFTQGLGRKVVDDDSLVSEDQLAAGVGADWFLLGALDDVLGVVRANDRLTVVT